MASVSNPAPVRRLRELLEEKQAPFFLDAYLEERGYSKKCSNSDSTKDCWLGSFLKNKENFPKCSRTMKSIIAKVVSSRNLKTLNCDTKACYEVRSTDFGIDSDMGRKAQVGELGEFSSASPKRKTSNFDIRSSDDGKFSDYCDVSGMEMKTQVMEFGWFSPASSMTAFDSCSEGNLEESPSPQHILFSPVLVIPSQL